MTQRERPFWCNVFVVLSDHLQAVWTLPPGDADYSTRWGAIEARFTRRAKASGVVGWNPTLRTVSKTANGDAGIWQRRFWEHTIRDERDYRNHMAYCWGNPVKYGLVERLTDWTYSSIHRDIRAGRVDTEWSGVITDGAFGEP
ncbi:transposase [uncultured Ruegeria sp.]|uniref:REP-associated tyrosine transposase n=1 Tax=uncultured Ruegeria sp. TaxID=259304 RepID=UPI0034398CD6